jgi:cell division protein FtsB
VTSNLDRHPNLIGALGEELTDGIFYLRSLARQIDELELQIDKLEKRNKYLEEMIKR